MGAEAADNKSRSRPELSALRVIKLLDKTSAKLLEAACKGTLYKKATISLCQPSGTVDTSSSWKRIVFFEILLQQVHISGVRLMGDPRLHYNSIGAGDVMEMGPLEEVDLSFRKVKWTYKGGTGKSNITGAWSLGTAATLVDTDLN